MEFYPIGGDPRVLSEFVVKHRCDEGRTSRHQAPIKAPTPPL